MTTKHTPGPWRKIGFSIGKGSGRRHLIADTYMQGSAAITEANARLIAAAPDLLATCKLLVATLDSPGRNLNTVDQCILGDALALIAKIENLVDVSYAYHSQPEKFRESHKPLC